MIASLKTNRNPITIAPKPAISVPTSRPITIEMMNTPPTKQATSISACIKPLIGMRFAMSKR